MGKMLYSYTLPVWSLVIDLKKKCLFIPILVINLKIINLKKNITVKFLSACC